MRKELLKQFKILFIEDSEEDVNLVKKYLKEISRFEGELEVALTLGEGLRMLEQSYFDLVLLDPNLPDSTGIETVTKLRAETQFNDVPIIVFTSIIDEEMGIDAIRRGAEDYLMNGQIQVDRLGKAIDCAIERHKLRTKIKDLSLTDELTGCYNRRGFFMLAEQHLKLVHRNKKAAVLLFIDMDDLKKINDTFGHAQGDVAIAETADLLKKDFRKSDIIGRIGGDEFAIMAIDAREEDVQIIFANLIISVNQKNRSKQHPFQLSLSMGSVCYDPAKPASIETLLSEADQLMYTIKQKKKND